MRKRVQGGHLADVLGVGSLEARQGEDGIADRHEVSMRSPMQRRPAELVHLVGVRATLDEEKHEARVVLGDRQQGGSLHGEAQQVQIDDSVLIDGCLKTRVEKRLLLVFQYPRTADEPKVLRRCAAQRREGALDGGHSVESISLHLANDIAAQSQGPQPQRRWDVGRCAMPSAATTAPAAAAAARHGGGGSRRHAWAADGGASR
mmetsp:Transcript_148938/g.478572  ORF Transcript_148938/g.478572 Transcript_148938/m.478572 type:complete len:204 (-) Transcript_148938:13-624(-)